jgi:indole-3-glycerol phosphate synthase
MNDRIGIDSKLGRVEKPDILLRIERYKRLEVQAAKERIPWQMALERAHNASSPKPFAAAIQAHIEAGRPALIAEIKKASPSKGIIRMDFEPARLAADYRDGGATCLSVLTDEPSFQGRPDYLRFAREESGLPTLCKDFLLDPYQVLQARSWGADCILVIMASVSDTEAEQLVSDARDLGMDILVEVHNVRELDRALKLDTRLIGINNRDLHTFQVSLSTTEDLAPRIPLDRIVVSESGISGHEDLERLSSAGVRAFLVGETLMRQPDVRAATRSLLFGPLPKIEGN